MKLKNAITTALAAAGLITALPLCAAPLGTAFSYQGRLTDGGAPANGIYDFVFVIYRGATNDLPLVSGYPIENVPVTNGVFTAQIDFGPGVFNGDVRWLETVVRTNDAPEFTALAPRQQLSATPYALHAMNAAKADTVANVPWSAVTNLHASLADGVDNDTTYGAGAGISLNGQNQFQVNYAGSGSSNTAARSDHGHFGQEWKGATNNAPGLRVQNTSASGIGFWGKNDEYGSGYSPFFGAGVFGDSSTDPGVAGFSNTGPGVYGWISALSGTYDAVKGENPSTTGRAVAGYATSTNGANIGALGQTASSGGGVGVRGYATATTGSSYGGRFSNKSPNGAALHGYSDQSTVADLEITAVNNSSEVVKARTDGTGAAGRFTVGNPASAADALIAQHYGRGDALFASTLGSGNAGHFQLTVNHTNNAAVLANAIGSGKAIHAQSSAGLALQAVSSTTAIRAEGGDVAVSARAPGATALEIDGGAIRVKGAGQNTSTAAFVHKVTANNTPAMGPYGNPYTIINNSLCNGRSDAILMVTERTSFDISGRVVAVEGLSVGYHADSGRWRLYNESIDELGDFDEGDLFNVMVILP